MIEVEHLTKRYGEVLAVDDVSFAVGDGEVVGFLGPNGAGKSTTLRILTCYMPATRGTVKIAGLDVLTRSLEVRRRLGYLPESVPVYPDMRVEEFLRFRALLKQVPRREVKAKVERALDRCRCLDMRRRMIHGLSKGYRQRVGLADAIVHDPPLIILDEPTSGLDPNQRVEVRNLIASLGQDKTVMLSSHILAEVEAVARRVIIIDRGHIVAHGTPADLVREHAGRGRLRLEVQGAADRVGAALRSVPGARVASEQALPDAWRAYELEFEDGADRRADVAQAVIGAEARLRELTAPAASLEAVFRRLTVGGGDR